MNQEKIGLFISKLRKEKNLTQKDLGDLLDITDNSVSKWERGINAPDISQLKRIASIFNITVGELLNGERNFKKRENNNGERVLEVKNLSKTIDSSNPISNLTFLLIDKSVSILVKSFSFSSANIVKLAVLRKEEDPLRLILPLITFPCISLNGSSFHERTVMRTNCFFIFRLSN